MPTPPGPWERLRAIADYLPRYRRWPHQPGKRPGLGLFGWSRSEGVAAISPLVAAPLARFGAVTWKPRTGRAMFAELFVIPMRASRNPRRRCCSGRVRIADADPPTRFLLPDNEPFTGSADPEVVGGDHGRQPLGDVRHLGRRPFEFCIERFALMFATGSNAGATWCRCGAISAPGR